MTPAEMETLGAPFGIDMDVFAEETDPNEIREAIESLLIPDGWYQTEVPLKVSEKKTKETGRDYVNCFGAVLLDGEPKGHIGFIFSPKLVQKDGKPDWLYKEWLKIRKVYTAVMGEEPKSPRHVIKFLSEYPIGVKIGRSEDKQSGEMQNRVFAFGKVRD